MQYGFPRFILIFSVAVIYLSLCEKSEVDGKIGKSRLVIKSDKNISEMINGSSEHHLGELSTKSTQKRAAKCKYLYEQMKDVGRRRNRYRSNKISRVRKKNMCNDDDGLIKHKTSFFVSSVDDYYDKLVDEDTEGMEVDYETTIVPQVFDDLPDLLDDIEVLIDEFQDVSKDLDHKKVHRTPLDQSTSDIFMWENANRVLFKSKKNLTNEWSQWSEWSPCSVTCGQGIRMRNRFKLTENVPAEIQELQEKKCIMPDCPPFSLSRFLSKVFFAQ